MTELRLMRADIKSVEALRVEFIEMERERRKAQREILDRLAEIMELLRGKE
jgi:hypothetical protein